MITGIDNETQPSFSVFPIPAAHNLTVKWFKNSKVSHIELHDAVGRVIAKQTISADNETTLNFAQYASGIYWIVLKNQNEVIGTRKVVK